MKHRGFTLLELLVTLAIAAILAALALPATAPSSIARSAMRPGWRCLASSMPKELHYQRFNAYTDALTLPDADGGLGLAAHSTDGSYALTVSTSDDGQRYSATARPLPVVARRRTRPAQLFLIDEPGRGPRWMRAAASQPELLLATSRALPRAAATWAG